MEALYELVTQKISDFRKSDSKSRSAEIRQSVMEIIYSEAKRFSDYLFEEIKKTKKQTKKSRKNNKLPYRDMYSRFLSDLHNIAGFMSSRKSIDKIFNWDYSNEKHISIIDIFSIIKLTLIVITTIIELYYPILIVLFKSDYIDDVLKEKIEQPFFKITPENPESGSEACKKLYDLFKIDIRMNYLGKVPDSVILRNILFKTETPVLSGAFNLKPYDIPDSFKKYIKDITYDNDMDHNINIVNKILFNCTYMNI